MRLLVCGSRTYAERRKMKTATKRYLTKRVLITLAVWILVAFLLKVLPWLCGLKWSDNEVYSGVAGLAIALSGLVVGDLATWNEEPWLQRRKNRD